MQIAPVHCVKAEGINLQPVERAIGDFCGDDGLACDIGKVTDAAQQTTGDAGRTACAFCNLVRAIGRNAKVKQTGGAGYHQLKLAMRVEIEPHRNAKAVTQGRGQQTLPRGRTDQRKRGQINPHGPRRWPFANHDIQRTVFHRGVEDFLNHGAEPVDFVNEQDVAILQIGEQRRQIARFGDDRTRCGTETDAHFLGHNLRQCRLAKPRRAKEQYMVQRLPATLRRLNKHAQIVARGRLPDKFGQRFGPQRGVDIFWPFIRRGEAVVVSHNVRYRHP